MRNHIMEERTDSYLGTYNPQSKADQRAIANLRAFVKKMNAYLKEEGRAERYYVKAQGRLGTDNPNARVYRERNRRRMYGAYQTIKLEHAARVDLYIYKRRS